MQRVYHGAFVAYLEVARVEALRSVGFPYKKMEDSGTLLPVKSMEMEFIKPVEYDEELKIVTRVMECPTARIKFGYEVFNAAGDLVLRASTDLVFVEATSGKPRRAPEAMKSALGF
jgi:acyl-CoA thioester hydrolase